jgi:hypothetical protein
MVLLMVDELGLMGSWAPQGWSCRQEDEQALSPLQPVTHWLPHSWQTKKGIVWVYWVTLGLRPSPHSQENWRVSESQVFSFVVKVSEGGCRQISCGRRVLVDCHGGEYTCEYIVTTYRTLCDLAVAPDCSGGLWDGVWVDLVLVLCGGKRQQRGRCEGGGGECLHYA